MPRIGWSRWRDFRVFWIFWKTYFCTLVLGFLPDLTQTGAERFSGVRLPTGIGKQLEFPSTLATVRQNVGGGRGGLYLNGYNSPTEWDNCTQLGTPVYGLSPWSREEECGDWPLGGAVNRKKHNMGGCISRDVSHVHNVFIPHDRTPHSEQLCLQDNCCELSRPSNIGDYLKNWGEKRKPSSHRPVLDCFVSLEQPPQFNSLDCLWILKKWRKKNKKQKNLKWSFNNLPF